MGPHRMRTEYGFVLFCFVLFLSCIIFEQNQNMYIFLLYKRTVRRNGSQYMRQMSVISGHPIFTDFCRLTGCERDPRDRGVT